MKMRKVVSVVGAGNVGEHTASLLALRGLSLRAQPLATNPPSNSLPRLMVAEGHKTVQAKVLLRAGQNVENSINIAHR